MKNKKIIISIFVFFIILLIIVSIILINNTLNKTNYEIDKEKIYYEIKYFDTSIVNCINLLNNINLDDNFYINWEELENNSQSMYTYWNSVILDLNHLNIDNSHLIDFGKDLDKLTVSIKNKSKINTLENLLSLYNKLIIYSESLNYKNYNKILITKYNLLLSYSVAETGNWTLVYEYILEASQSINKIVNSLETYNNQYNINQAYIAIKELENIINIKDLNVFYIKYNIAINRLENI